MSSTQDLDYPQLLFQYNSGFLLTKIMTTACELGVFDLLLESEGPLPSDVIAERLGTSAYGMERLLEACVGLKLLAVEMKSERAFYRNTELSNLYLGKASPKSQYHHFMYYSKTNYLCCHYLTDAVREGKKQYKRAFGISSEDLFEVLYRSEEEMIKVTHFLNAFWSVCGRDMISAFDLSPFTVICDLGGGAGGLARECISLYPNSTVTIYDLPKVVQLAKEHFVTPEESRITFHGGDFFTDPIPEADLYIVARVLHDWADDKCLELLSKIHKVCKPGGGVLLVESLVDDDKTGPLDALLLSVIMLVQTEGKERTPSEFRKLLTAAGFREMQVKKTGKLYDVILGRK
ncbi:acetylserotonin O-methyltransferase-like [Pelodiscus sinensis]|uniref:acetylserotonin O-methyltransferase-like n=1 Tax=Pelodiscus sinensis TaxID=13735 RepID=UPI003F6D031D